MNLSKAVKLKKKNYLQKGWEINHLFHKAKDQDETFQL